MQDILFLKGCCPMKLNEILLRKFMTLPNKTKRDIDLKIKSERNVVIRWREMSMVKYFGT